MPNNICYDYSQVCLQYQCDFRYCYSCRASYCYILWKSSSNQVYLLLRSFNRSLISCSIAFSGKPTIAMYSGWNILEILQQFIHQTISLYVLNAFTSMLQQRLPQLYIITFIPTHYHCIHRTLKNKHINPITKMQKFQLDEITSSDYFNPQYNLDTTAVYQLSYTLFVGSVVSDKLKVQKMAYRLIKSAKSQHSNDQSCTDLVLVQKVATLPSHKILAPHNLIRRHTSTVVLTRPNLSIINLNNNLLPKLTQAKELNVYIHTMSKYVDIIKQLLSQGQFIVPADCRREVYINFSLFKNTKMVKQEYKQTNCLLYRRLIAQNLSGKYTNYLKLNVKGAVQQIQSENIKYNSCIFVGNKTKLKLQVSDNYDLNQIVKIIQVPKLYELMFSTDIYNRLRQQINQIIQYKPDKKLVLLKSTAGLGISSFLHNLAQISQYNFSRINCKYFASDKQLIDRIKNTENYSSTILYIKNIQWLLQLGTDKNDTQQKMKRIIRNLEDAFYNQAEHSFMSYIIIISYKGNSIKFDMAKNANLIKFQLNKEQRINSLKQVTQYFQKQLSFTLESTQEIINIAANSLGWATFSKILKRLHKSQQNKDKIKTQKVLAQIAKLVSMEKVQNIKNISWADVGGLQNAKEQIIQTILLPTKHPQIFDQWIKPRTGLLFYGPPGTGKTLLGKCIANQCKMGFISVKGPQLLNMYIGESEKNVRQVFQRAAASKPCIVFMDQLDALIPKRGQSSDSNQVMDRIVSQLLTQMDQAPNNGIFVIGATNRPDLLDPSIMRPGRFDKQIYLGITKQKQARIQILKAQTRHITLKQGFDYQKVIDQVPVNFTGADFYGLTSRSITKAAERFIQQYQKKQRKQNQDVTVTQQDFISTAKQMKPSVSLQELSHYEKLKQQYK